MLNLFTIAGLFLGQLITVTSMFTNSGVAVCPLMDKICNDNTFLVMTIPFSFLIVIYWPLDDTDLFAIRSYCLIITTTIHIGQALVNMRDNSFVGMFTNYSTEIGLIRSFNLFC